MMQSACDGKTVAPLMSDGRMQIDVQTYSVRADGHLLTCEPATVLPMQRYFLF